MRFWEAKNRSTELWALALADEPLIKVTGNYVDNLIKKSQLS